MLEFILPFAGAFAGGILAYYLLPRGKATPERTRPLPAPPGGLLGRVRQRAMPEAAEIHTNYLADRKQAWLFGAKEGDS